jgi:hypothetical protein
MKKLVSLIIFAVLLAACGGGSVTYESATAPAPPAAPQLAEVAWEMDDYFDSSTGFGRSDLPPTPASNTVIDERMVIRTSEISLEVSDFNGTVVSIEEIINSYGGFVENANQWQFSGNVNRLLWQGNFTLRVPVAHFDTVNGLITELGHVNNFSAWSEDITLQFTDMQSRLAVREEEERRILSVMENTDDLEILIELEARLANTRIVLERYRRRMIELDHLASFSTITVWLREASENEYVFSIFDGFTGRIASAFSNSVSLGFMFLEGIGVVIAALAVPVSLMAVFALIVYRIFKKAKAHSVKV